MSSMLTRHGNKTLFQLPILILSTSGLQESDAKFSILDALKKSVCMQQKSIMQFNDFFKSFQIARITAEMSLKYL
jgi:hypothetical protein